MRYLGDFLVGATVRGMFNTRTGVGAPITLGDSPAFRVYKDGGTTEDDSGLTLTVDFDGRTGLHQWVVDTSADGTFFSAASDFYAVLTVGTVDGVSVVGVCIGQFSIRNRSLEDFGETAADIIDDLYTEAETRFLPVDAHKQRFVTAAGERTTYEPDGTTPTAYSPTTLTTDPDAEPITGTS